MNSKIDLTHICECPSPNNSTVTLRATLRGTLRRTGFWFAVAFAGFTRIDTFRKNFVNYLKLVLIIFFRSIEPGLLLVAEIVEGAASAASSPGYSGKTMPETCALFVYNFEIFRI